MNMIRKTRRKFVWITISAISLVLVLILGILNLCVYCAVYFNGRENIELLLERHGFVFSGSAGDVSSNSVYGIMPNLTDSSGKVAYMYVQMRNSGDFSPFITTNMSDSYSSNEIYELACMMSESGIDKGVYQNMMYEVSRSDIYTTVVIVDIANDMNLLSGLLRISLVIIVCSLVFVFLFTYFLSKWALRPVQTAFENQRRFISDASHELKTPLTVISANADALELEIGDSRWLGNIKNQSVMMSELVHDLLDLAKLDETHEDMAMAEFDLSSAVLSKTLEFECTAFENQKQFEQNIKENIWYRGNEDSIKHLISILIDNAIRHSDEQGIIRVTLTTSGNKRIFQVYNTGNGIREEEKEKIFNRFYRSDKSRSRETGGYGLGLSIAKAIVDSHKGSISVDGEENQWVSFTVIL